MDRRTTTQDSHNSPPLDFVGLIDSIQASLSVTEKVLSATDAKGRMYVRVEIVY
jgi:hypothetical protein